MAVDAGVAPALSGTALSGFVVMLSALCMAKLEGLHSQYVMDRHDVTWRESNPPREIALSLRRARRFSRNLVSTIQPDTAFSVPK